MATIVNGMDGARLVLRLNVDRIAFLIAIAAALTAAAAAIGMMPPQPTYL